MLRHLRQSESYIGDYVTTIQPYAFTYANLEEISLPKNITINDYAFQECTLLKNVTYRGSKKDWEKICNQNDVGSLAEAKIHCMYATSTNVENNNFKVAVDEEYKGKSVILALYQNGNFVKMIEKNMKAATLNLTTLPSRIQMLKFLFGNTLDDMSPLSGAETMNKKI